MIPGIGGGLAGLAGGFPDPGVVVGTPSGAGAATGATISLPTGAAAGDLMLIFAASVITPAISGGSGGSFVQVYYNLSSFYDAEIKVWYRVLTAGDISGAVTFTVNTGGNSMAWSAITYRGPTAAVAKNNGQNHPTATGAFSLTGHVQNSEARKIVVYVQTNNSGGPGTPAVAAGASFTQQRAQAARSANSYHYIFDLNPESYLDNTAIAGSSFPVGNGLDYHAFELT